MLCPGLCVLIERVKEPQEVYMGGRRLSLFLLLQHISAGVFSLSVCEWLQRNGREVGCFKHRGWSCDLFQVWPELPVLCERCKDTSSVSWCVSVRESFRLKHWMVINLQPAGLHFEEKIAVLGKRILTRREQETCDRGDVLASETNSELGSLLYVLQGSAGVQVSDA